jgi:threonine aldolase
MPAPVTPGCQFASDNTAPICPAAWEAVQRANAGCEASYGNDPWTARACDLIREMVDGPAEVFFVFNGTAANSLALAAMCQSYHAILCHEMAHVETDECGAPEFFSNGTKLLLLSGPGGKITPQGIAHAVERRRDIHYPKPRVVSVTQATELSTAYSIDELAAIGETCRRHGLRLHMDGARFANAVAALGVAPRAITRDVGVDVLCLGGTKNGMGVGEAVVFFDTALAEEFAYRCKQAGQLASKMRYLTAPWVGLLESGAWLENARRANAAAARLEAAAASCAPGRPPTPTWTRSWPTPAASPTADRRAPWRRRHPWAGCGRRSRWRQPRRSAPGPRGPTRKRSARSRPAASSTAGTATRRSRATAACR